MSRRKLIVGMFLGLSMVLTVFCAPKTAGAFTSTPPIPGTLLAQSSAAVPAAPHAKLTWKQEWEKTLAAAKKEGTVVLTSDLSNTACAFMAERFKKAYGITLESISGKGSEIAMKVITERRAGLYNYDVYMSGSTTALIDLKPAGAFDSLEPALILPDLTNQEIIKKIWWQGKLWWVDAEHTHLSPILRLIFSIAINTNLVKEEEIKSYYDLLNPKWQGKLVLNDPTIAGVGNTVRTFAEAVLGWDYLVKLSKANPIILRDARQMFEWLAHGKVALVMAPKPEVLTEFIQAGAPVKGIIPAEGTSLVGGATNISIYNRQPHPNAAKVFINWYLSKEGQTVVSQAIGAQSARLDVPTVHLPPEQLRQPGGKYCIIENEQLQLASRARLNKAIELFGPLVK